MKAFLQKHKILLSIELISILLGILACFIPEKLVFSADAEEIADAMMASGYSDYYYSEEMTLSPGIYQLRVQSRDHEGKLYPTVQAGNTTFQALRCNGATLFAHQREMEIEVYVVSKVDTAFVSCNYIGETGQPIEKISLYATSIGWRVLTAILVFSALGLNSLIWLRSALVNHRISKAQEMVFWVLAASVLIAYLPYLLDYFSTGADGTFHLLRIEGLKETLLHGDQLPVRVQEYWLYGHGYAVSSFYGDLFLLFPAMLRLIGFNLMDAYKLFVLAVLIATAIIAYYSFYQCTGNRYGALLGSVLYELAPYHIYNIYNRNAVGEYLGMMFFPLVLCGVYRIYTWDRQKPEYTRAKIPLIVGLSCILQSHILSCEMVIAALLLTCIFLWKRTFQKRIFKELTKAAVWCLLINAWFWVPLLKMLSADHYALGEIVSQNIQSRGTRIAGILQIFPYMGGAQTGMYNCEPIQLGAAFWAILLCFLIVKVCYRSSAADLKNPYGGIMTAGLLLSIVSLFASTRNFPWDFLAKIPLLGTFATAIQFPTRLLSIATLFSAFTAAFFVPWLQAEKELRRQGLQKTMLIGCILGVAVIAFGLALYHVNDISYNISPIRLYTAENLGMISVVNGEYLLEGMDIQEMGYHDPVADEGLLLNHYDKEGLTIHLDVRSISQEERYMELPVTGYRGYSIEAAADTAAATAAELPYITEQRGAHGDLRIAVPAGYEGEITVSYTGFRISRVAELISCIAVLCSMGIWIRKRYARTKENAHGQKGESQSECNPV